MNDDKAGLTQISMARKTAAFQVRMPSYAH